MFQVQGNGVSRSLDSRSEGEIQGIVNKPVGFEQKNYIGADWEMNPSSPVEGSDYKSRNFTVSISTAFNHCLLRKLQWFPRNRNLNKDRTSELCCQTIAPRKKCQVTLRCGGDKDVSETLAVAEEI